MHIPCLNLPDPIARLVTERAFYYIDREFVSIPMVVLAPKSVSFLSTVFWPCETTNELTNLFVLNLKAYI